jgi:hypothetical protein
LTAEAVIKKLAIIESNPKNIWKNLENIYGFGFFNRVIEEEFGISP